MSGVYLLALQIIGGLLCAVWLFQSALFWLNARQLGRLLDVDSAEPDPWPKLSIVIPAKDEATSIEAAISTRLADDYPDLELIIVDDRSTDDTGKIATRIAASDRRVRCVRVDELPKGWLGKVHALQRGSEQASGEWILFSDADVHIEPGTMRRAVAYAVEKDLGHLGLVPEYRTQSWLLDSLWSVFLRILMIMLSPKRIADPNSKKALGSGAFNLVSRKALEGTPGFEWLKLDTTDDMSLALMIKKAGFKTEGLDGRGAASVLIYRDLAEFFSGTQKNAGVLLGLNLPVFLIGCVLWLTLEWSPILALALALATGSGWLTALGLAALAAALSVNVGALHINTGRFVPGLLWPLGSAVFVFALVRALWLAQRNGGIYWRGTFYSSEELLKERKFEF